ncbi:MAG: hypothetical protein HY066_04065 [Betaproteobacteria bacterium]|nr:hypothetical protein [Betaproteobacteria bacterium]
MNPESRLQPDDLLLGAVQRNCHITDARHARGMTLCNYLLEMREFYRWECDLPLAEPPPRAAVGRWLAAREALWNDLDDSGADYGPLPVGAELFDPFATDAINRSLFAQGMVYGAGIGRFHKPHFFVGELLRRERRGGVDILVSGREYVRDLNAAPAALQRGTVYLRQEALRRWLWEKVESWNLRPRPGAIQATLDSYGYAADPHQAIERMTVAESETLILHELGEHAAGLLLGPDWEEMLSGFSHRRAEILARAIRDNLADCLSTLPALLERDAQASLHFWFANFEGMRQALFPRLTAAYAVWNSSGDSAPLRAALTAGRSHWQALAACLLDAYRQRGAAAESEIETLAEGLETLAL